MKKLITLVWAAMAASVMALSAQTGANPEFIRLLQENRARAGVNTHSYEVMGSMADTPAPKGYKPFYISHYGRHGSRSNWGDWAYKGVIKPLTEGRDKGILTSEGEALLSEAQTILDRYDGMDGRLTPRGVREHKQIAERMYHRFPNVFRKGPKSVRVECSTVQRCIISMASFTNALTACQPDLEWSFDTGEKFFAYISNESSREHRKKVDEMLKPIYEAPVDTTWVLSHLFTDPEAGHEIVGNVDNFETCIWYTACIAEDFDVNSDVFRHLPFDVVYKWYDALNRDLYMNQCNSVELGADRMERCRPLVDDILKKADEVVADGTYSADLKFGHDYPVLALASFLGIEGVGDRMTFNEVPEKWFGPANVCMASNLQIIFYRNKSGHVLVKFLYNEQERHLRGLTPVTGPYYDWTTVRANIEGFTR